MGADSDVGLLRPLNPLSNPPSVSFAGARGCEGNWVIGVFRRVKRHGFLIRDTCARLMIYSCNRVYHSHTHTHTHTHTLTLLALYYLEVVRHGYRHPRQWLKIRIKLCCPLFKADWLFTKPAERPTDRKRKRVGPVCGSGPSSRENTVCHVPGRLRRPLS